MDSSLVSMWVMIILGAVLPAMKVMAAVWLHRQQSPATWLILIGAILYAVAQLVQFSLLDSRGIYDSEQTWLLELTLQSQGMADFLFITGFVIFAARLRGERKRIAELETILHDQQRSLPPVER